MPLGITSDAARAYQASHGFNEIVEQKPSLFAKIFKRAISPISLMLLLAAVLSYASGKFFDGGFILILLVANIAITLWQEQKADTAIEKLNEHLATSVKTLRDGTWQNIPSRELVPHDVLELRAGDVVPADATVYEAHSASANEAALTGESLPKEKKENDALYSGSFLASGIVRAEVSAIGNGTFFGKTITKVDVGSKRSALERQIIRISQLLSALSLVAVAILTTVLYLSHAPLLEILRLDLSLVIAGIPISLPTVMTIIIAFGVIALAKAGVIVRRLSSLQDLADTDYLLTDKTGTLTQNSITVDTVIAYGAPESEVVSLAGAVAINESDAALNKAILARALLHDKPDVISFVPGDLIRKHSTATIATPGGPVLLALGAPQVVESFCDISHEDAARLKEDVDRLAQGGYRTLALARGRGGKEEGMQLLGLLSLSDALRPDAGEVMRFLVDNGVGVSMVTGDNRAIAREIAGKLQVPGTSIITPEQKPAAGWGALEKHSFDDAQSFAEILPEDKYELVRSAKRFFTVASNGDGVNDLPAVKEADVGFAVRNAVDALKGAADIVLTSDGIAVMADAFVEGRKIFARLYAYSVYRISESFRLIVTIAILGLLSGTYPLSPLQLILIALLNDIPIISLAANRVREAKRPSHLNVRRQFTMSILFGLVGVFNSMLLYFLALYWLHLPVAMVQTLFFLKLTVSGHLLLYVAHTEERWWSYLPSPTVIAATLLTQLAATALAITGFLMPAGISWQLAVFVWAWAFIFMQLTEVMKLLRERFA